MPRVHTQKARKNIYRSGKHLDDPTTKSGKRIDRSQPRDENDEILIPKGSTYYKWTFRYGGTHRSLTRPKPSQLTQSEFLGTIYAIEEDIPTFESKEDLLSWVQETIMQLEELRDEQEEKRSNMPESLQDAPTGELLQERYDAVDEMINELSEIEGRCEDEDEELDDLISDLPQYEGS